MTSFSAAVSPIPVADYPVTFLFGVKDGSPDTYGKVPFADILKKDASGAFNAGGVGIKSGASTVVAWLAAGTAFNTGGAAFALRGDSVGYNNGGMEWYTGGLERARLDANGKMMIGTTVPSGLLSMVTSGETGLYLAVAGPNYVQTLIKNNVGGAFLNFVYSGGGVGSVTTNGTSTAYNTTSDYRLKTDLQPLSGAWSRIKSIAVYDHGWTNKGGRSRSVLAHELATIVPDAVHGEKDAMQTVKSVITPAAPAVLNNKGEVVTPAVPEVSEMVQVPAYQGVDYSKLVPDLIAALQEAQERIEALEAALAA